MIFFLPLFFIGLLNRESAIFIPLWLIIDAFEVKQQQALGL